MICYISNKPNANGILLEAPFRKDFLELLKEHIPENHRTWLPKEKAWYISAKYKRQAIIDAKQFYEVEEV